MKWSEMRKWNYRTAWSYFTEHATRKICPEMDEYIYRSKTAPVERISSDFKKRFEEYIRECSLIILDGESATGKTTLAKFLKERYDVAVVDIDLLCIEWMKEQEAKMNPKDFFQMMLTRFDEESNKYLLNNLERIVNEAGRNGKKSVVLVGAFIEVPYRTVIGNTIGRKFKNVVGFTFFEPDIKKLFLRDEQRRIEMNISAPNDGIREKMMHQHRFLENLIQKWLPLLGKGMDVSFLCQSGFEVSDRLK